MKKYHHHITYNSELSGTIHKMDHHVTRIYPKQFSSKEVEKLLKKELSNPTVKVKSVTVTKR